VTVKPATQVTGGGQPQWQQQQAYQAQPQASPSTPQTQLTGSGRVQSGVYSPVQPQGAQPQSQLTGSGSRFSNGGVAFGAPQVREEGRRERKREERREEGREKEVGREEDRKVGREVGERREKRRRRGREEVEGREEERTRRSNRPFFSLATATDSLRSSSTDSAVALWRSCSAATGMSFSSLFCRLYLTLLPSE